MREPPRQSQLQLYIDAYCRRVSSFSALDLQLSRDSALSQYAAIMLRRLSKVVSMGSGSDTKIKKKDKKKKKNKVKVKKGKGKISEEMTEEERESISWFSFWFCSCQYISVKLSSSLQTT